MHLLVEPYFPIEIFEMMYDFSLFLIVDDKNDLGHFGYTNRKEHYYHFTNSPEHPSPFHHWQVGVIGLLISQTGALISKALEIRNYMRQQQQPINITPIQQQKKTKSLPLPPPSNNDVYSKLLRIAS